MKYKLNLKELTAMKRFFARHKKLISFVSVLSLVAACAVSASAMSQNYSTDRYHSSSQENGDGTYYLKTEYHVGSTAPWDDAYVYAEARALKNKGCEAGYEFGGQSHSIQKYDPKDDLMPFHDGYKIPGQDTGIGHCYAQTFSGRSLSDSVVNYQRLDIG